MSDPVGTRFIAPIQRCRQKKGLLHATEEIPFELDIDANQKRKAGPNDPALIDL